MALMEVARMVPRAWPEVRDPGSVEVIREASGGGEVGPGRGTG